MRFGIVSVMMLAIFAFAVGVIESWDKNSAIAGAALMISASLVFGACVVADELPKE